MCAAPLSGPPTSAHGLSADRAVRLPQLLEAMRSAGRGLEPHSTPDRSCETAAALTGARYAAIGVVAEDGDGLVDFVRQGPTRRPPGRPGGCPTGARNCWAPLIRDPEPIRGPALNLDRRSCGFPEHHPPMRGFLGIPIGVRGEIFGNTEKAVRGRPAARAPDRRRRRRDREPACLPACLPAGRTDGPVSG
ncbi:hypothetical protein ADK57_24480 [Streptomyces sp. MMG1533]|uniref:GAF domain-containing protein n=1 Tax=Streptomyces sp. MMG1533 TaxID=1415546 RepID=UPI0006AEBC2F|nr:hypothetical protein ADK57_24480 [Streptomyces sp. MMG1533]